MKAISTQRKRCKRCKRLQYMVRSLVLDIGEGTSWFVFTSSRRYITLGTVSRALLMSQVHFMRSHTCLGSCLASKTITLPYRRSLDPVLLDVNEFRCCRLTCRVLAPQIYAWLRSPRESIYHTRSTLEYVAVPVLRMCREAQYHAFLSR